VAVDVPSNAWPVGADWARFGADGCGGRTARPSRRPIFAVEMAASSEPKGAMAAANSDTSA